LTSAFRLDGPDVSLFNQIHSAHVSPSPRAIS